MKISINVDEKITDTEISISCARLTPEIEKILATLRILERKLMVAKKDESYILDVSDIVYIESEHYADIGIIPHMPIFKKCRYSDF